jgi:hypothetical protein
MPRYKHIHLRGLGEVSDSFDPPGGGSTRRPAPIQNRRVHARRIRNDLSRIAREFSSYSDLQANVEVPPERRGQAVAVEGRRGEELDIGSAGVDSRNPQILNIKRTTESGNISRPRDQATVFVTPKNIESLLSRLTQYEEWDERTARGRRPVGFWLFESAENFRQATIEDFWTDTLDNFPSNPGSAEWEVWIRHSLDVPFRKTIEEIGLEIRGNVTKFVDTSVRSVLGTRRQITKLVNQSAAVVELRGASSFIAEHSDLPPEGRHLRVDGIAARIVPANQRSPLVTLLDTGVNRNNPLLQGSLPASRCHVAEQSWDRFDPDGHGTKMAGVALFNDLSQVARSTEQIHLEVGLESVTVSAPGSAVRLPARDALSRAVNMVEAASQRRRVYCLSATAPGEAEDGRPTSTSATLDKLAFGDGTNTRLICAAVGNVPTTPTDPYDASLYEARNEDHGIQSPAQALNALSVGAITHKCVGNSLLAPLGDLSPTSRTALAWEMLHPHKPDIVMEGGNHILDALSNTSRPHVPNMIATTSRNIANRPITVTGETSAANAAAAGLAGRLIARYPEMRAETVRGLMAHSAHWTDAMENRLAEMISDGESSQDATEQILQCYGWGIPDEERLFWSAQDALTLIVEDTLRPYKRSATNPNSISLREMKYFRLPWPDAALSDLGNTEVVLRCTLSYFVEPDPQSATRDRFDRYPSHRLKFDFKRFDETDEQAQSRFNRAVEAEGGAGGDDEGWLLGSRRKSRGTLHQDIWRGPGYKLEGRNGVSVAPIRGWWGDRPGMSPDERSVQFSLIVSITTPSQTVDLFAEAMAKVPAELLVSAPTVIRT